MVTVAATNALITSILREPVEEVPVPPILCVRVGCGLPMVAMVYQWRPDGLSVYEARCRDHQSVGDQTPEVPR